MQQSHGQPQPGRIVVAVELGMTPPATGMERLNKAALDAVQRVYTRGGATVHYAGVRLIDR